MNTTTTTTTTQPSASTLPQPDIYTAISLLSISTFTCLLLYYLIFDLSFFPPNPLKAPTTTTLITTITTTTTTTTLLSTTFTILLLFNLPPNNPRRPNNLRHPPRPNHHHLQHIQHPPALLLPPPNNNPPKTRLLPPENPTDPPLWHNRHHPPLPTPPRYRRPRSSHPIQERPLVARRHNPRAHLSDSVLREGDTSPGQYYYQYQPHTGHGKGTQLLYTLLMAGCVSLILNIANIVAVYVVHTAAAMAFFPLVVSTKVLVEGVAVGRLVGFVDTPLQYYQQNSSIYSVTGCGSQSRRGSAQPLIMQRGSVAMMSGGLGSSVGIGEGKDGGSGGSGSEGEGSPGGTWGREKEQWWYRSRMGSVDTVVSVAEPPVAHSAEHLVQEVVVDLEGGAGVGVSRRTSVV
ncbi:hypothetical protein AKAW_05122 [Aspergillus luchuensis IFO 4308]|nr:hypothetical protein AKAW_05122 [Aspergillus luchuensis IFO 4308]